ncbi:MAG: hypothetical protein JO257_16925 [Deltaproteobacteria bacterium]|nr:hypothetical protein [Deltaproteobacteria bacterium]
MGAIQNLLGKLGYVKLDRYGLLLTPDGRVLSQRPSVLDDGLGGRIVGWEDGDLAAMELEPWEPAVRAKKPAKLRATAGRVAVAMAPTIPAPARPQAPLAAKVVAPAAAAPAPVAAAPAPVVVAPPTPAPEVEAADEPEEDDWEWVVAIARARAAAEEAEAAAAAPKFVPAQTQPMAAVAKPAPVVAAKHAVPAKPVPPPLPPPGEDTKLGVKSYEPPTRAPSPKTIIPVPQLPRATGSAFVRPAVTPVTPPLRRVPRSTDRIEDTVRTSPAPANDDKTSPGIALPPAGGGRKVAAKQR